MIKYQNFTCFLPEKRKETDLVSKYVSRPYKQLTFQNWDLKISQAEANPLPTGLRLLRLYFTPN